jgi:cell division protein FtsL
MGENGEDRQGGDAGLTTAAEQQVFDTEIAAAVKYEKGLVVKAAIAVAIVAVVILLRVFFYG